MGCFWESGGTSIRSMPSSFIHMLERPLVFFCSSAKGLCTWATPTRNDQPAGDRIFYMCLYIYTSGRGTNSHQRPRTPLHTQLRPRFLPPFSPLLQRSLFE